MTVTTSQQPDVTNVQGFILRGYTHPFSCHLLFRFGGSEQRLNTEAFFYSIYSKVQSAKDWGTKKPASMLNIGLTFNGIKQLGILSDKELGAFPAEFQQGPWSTGSQQSLGDIYNNSTDPLKNSDPSNWWCKNFSNDDLHCIIHCYGLTKEALDTIVLIVVTSAQTNGLTELLPISDGDGRLYQSMVDNDADKIHFGYTDGISEPPLNASGMAGLPNQSDVNNFVIGYANGSVIQPGPSGIGTAAGFAFEGCYNAFRVLYQDVAVFNGFLKQQAATWAAQLSFLGLTPAQLEEWFAAKVMGRWRNGSPLMLSPDEPEAATAQGENFGFVEQNDTSPSQDINSGSKCPFSAHTRVANPRNQALDASEGSNGAPRIVRRGVPYGAMLNSDVDDGADRGLIGLFFCGSLAGQFEKLYTWMNYNNFSDKPVFSVRNPPQDATIGNRALAGKRNYPGLTTSFIIPLTNGRSITIPQLPQFIYTRGTAYCLLPSLSTIRLIAGMPYK